MENKAFANWLLLALLPLASCATTAPEVAPEAGGLSSEARDVLVATIRASLPEAVEENLPELPEGGYEEDFCRDDIYARFLIEEYRKAHDISKKLAKFRSKKSRSRAERKYELEAVHHAKHRLNGYLVPYFGALPIIANEKVEFWIRFFKTTGRRDFLHWLARGEAIREVLHPLLKQEGMPIELFYLAMVESGFKTNAYSSKSATGPWQFMRGTAQIYGLKMNHWVDERRDPVKSTIAASRYLRDLYFQFGDWYLAMAAYNAGPGRVRRAIRKAKSRDFWEIVDKRALATETSQYVPKVLAALLLSSNPKAHGFEVKANGEHRIPSTLVKLDRPMQLTEISRELNVPLKTLQGWNPELVRDITPPCRGCDYEMRLGETHVQRFAEIAANLPQIDIQDVHLHQIRQGDTLSALARRYNVRINQILEMNPNLAAKTLRIGKHIAIPIPGVVVRR